MSSLSDDPLWRELLEDVEVSPKERAKYVLGAYGVVIIPYVSTLLLVSIGICAVWLILRHIS